MIVIIGSGFAGYTLASEIRKIDGAVSITIITSDNGDYYSKPSLSSAFMQKKSADDLVVMSAKKMQEKLNITVLTHETVLQIDEAKSEVITKNITLLYSKCVFAVGAKTIGLNLLGNGVQDIISVNDLDDYRQLRTQLTDKKSVTIIGGGLIGVEFACDLSFGGYDVTVISDTQSPLHRLVPEEVGLALKEQLSMKRNVQWVTEAMAHTVDKKDNIFTTVTDTNQRIHSDVVISAVGLKPNVDLAHAIGMIVNDGIVVDRYLRTNCKKIYAIGDCAEVDGYCLQYIAPIRHCSIALAKTLCGELTAVEYPPLPVTVKTPIYPIVACLPRRNLTDIVPTISGSKDSYVVEYKGQNDLIQGFVLTGSASRDRAEYLSNMKPWL